MITQNSRQEPSICIDEDHIILELDNIRELLVASDIDPFSDKETEYMGESAVIGVLRQLRPGWTLLARNFRVTIRLPPDQITQGLSEKVKGAIHHFCQTRIEDNTTQLRNVRWNGFRQMPFSFVFLAVCIIWELSSELV